MLPDAPWLLPALAALLGLLVGSFLNVVAFRLPVMMERAWRRESEALLVPAAGPAPGPEAEEPYDLVRPRSACPACHTPIKPWHNVPVLGWLWLKGRCASCQAPIAGRYPVVEALTGLVSGFLVWQFGWTADAIGALLITWSLIALTLIDLDHQLLPDSITLPLLWAGLLFHVLTGPHATGSPFAATLADGVIGAMAGYLSLWLVYHGFRLVTGKEGMGYGDFKLFAALLAWFGYTKFLPVLLLSAVSGSVIGIALIVFRRHAREVPIPFGPYLAAAGFVVLAFGEPLLRAFPFLAVPG